MELSAKDFQSPEEVRWCPGCGDYSILKQFTEVLASTGADPNRTVVVSGIGCSSRHGPSGRPPGGTGTSRRIGRSDDARA
ncbi:MAG: hypothetical protein ACO22A_06895 [Schleiferiaceae bacterium]